MAAKKCKLGHLLCGNNAMLLCSGQVVCRKCSYAYNEEYRKTHRKEAAERSRQWRKDNPERHKEQNREWTKNNPEKAAELGRRKRKKALEEHPIETRVKWVIKSHKRRARITGAGGNFTAQQWEDLKKFYDYKCVACGKTEDELIPLGLLLVPDHVQAIAMGGTNDISNIQPLCHAHKKGSVGGCNNKKRELFIDYRKKKAA
jgi:hypothetical protein